MATDLTDHSVSDAATLDAFEPGEVLNAAYDLPRLEGHVRRHPGESDAAYLARVARAGKAVRLTSEEIAGPGGMTALKQAIARATTTGVPVVMVSGERPDERAIDYNTPERDAAKAAALAAARRML